MRIALDGRTADVALGTGIGTYTRSLIGALSQVERRNEYLVAWPRDRKFDISRSRRFSPAFLSRHPRPEEDAGWLAATKPDVYHLPQNGFNLPQLPDCTGLVVTVHDLIPFLLPEMVRPGYLHKFIRQVPAAVTKADRIIAVSQCTARDLAVVLGADTGRITIVPNAPSRMFRELPPGECRKLAARRYGLTGPYLLHVGGTNPRKNLDTLLVAFARVRRGSRGCHS